MQKLVMILQKIMGKRIRLIYKQFYRKKNDRAVFVKVRIIQLATFGEVMHTLARNDQVHA